MTGYLISGIIFTCLMYLLLFQITDNARTNCEQRNAQVVEMNSRAVDINTLAETLTDYMVDRLGGDRDLIAEGTPTLRRTIRSLETVIAAQVRLDDCPKDFPDPWPFG